MPGSPAANGDQAEHTGDAGGEGNAHAEQGEENDASTGDETGCQRIHGASLTVRLGAGRGRGVPVDLTQHLADLLLGNVLDMHAP